MMAPTQRPSTQDRESAARARVEEIRAAKAAKDAERETTSDSRRAEQEARRKSMMERVMGRMPEQARARFQAAMDRRAAAKAQAQQPKPTPTPTPPRQLKAAMDKRDAAKAAAQQPMPATPTARPTGPAPQASPVARGVRPRAGFKDGGMVGGSRGCGAMVKGKKFSGTF